MKAEFMPQEQIVAAEKTLIRVVNPTGDKVRYI
jgi:hypothetical protein